MGGVGGLASGSLIDTRIFDTDTFFIQKAISVAGYALYQYPEGTSLVFKGTCRQSTPDLLNKC